MSPVLGPRQPLALGRLVSLVTSFEQHSQRCQALPAPGVVFPRRSPSASVLGLGRLLSSLYAWLTSSPPPPTAGVVVKAHLRGSSHHSGALFLAICWLRPGLHYGLSPWRSAVPRHRPGCSLGQLVSLRGYVHVGEKLDESTWASKGRPDPPRPPTV